MTAFGPFDQPHKHNPLTIAYRMAHLVKKHEFDGINVEWADDQSLRSGKAVSWLNLFTQRLRHLLPQNIIVHSPKASYFDEEAYEKGYALFHRLTGKAVDFYNIKYYKEGSYTNYRHMFESSGVSVKGLMQKGVSGCQIVVEKPLERKVSGWMDKTYMNWAFKKAYSSFGWYSGLAYWQYNNDGDGEIMRNSIKDIRLTCQQD